MQCADLLLSTSSSPICPIIPASQLGVTCGGNTWVASEGGPGIASDGPWSLCSYGALAASASRAMERVCVGIWTIGASAGNSLEAGSCLCRVRTLLGRTRWTLLGWCNTRTSARQAVQRSKYNDIFGYVILLAPL